MKYKLQCVLFGHTFRVRTQYNEDGELWTKSTASNFCRQCGLSKEEAGIKKYTI